MNEKNKNEIKIGKIKNLFFDKEIVSGLSDCIGLSRIISMFYDSGKYKLGKIGIQRDI